METVYYTKQFNSGNLKGICLNEQISYPTIQDCVDFIKAGKKGFKANRWNGHCASKIIDHSFQKYDRG